MGNRMEKCKLGQRSMKLAMFFLKLRCKWRKNVFLWWFLFITDREVVHFEGMTLFIWMLHRCDSFQPTRVEDLAILWNKLYLARLFFQALLSGCRCVELGESWFYHLCSLDFHFLPLFHPCSLVCFMHRLLGRGRRRTDHHAWPHLHRGHYQQGCVRSYM